MHMTMGSETRRTVQRSMSISKTMTQETHSPANLPDSVSTVLLTGPSTGTRQATCASLFETDPDSDVLFVTYTQPPTDTLTRATRDRQGGTSEVTVIAIGDPASTPTEPTVQTQSVTAPSDLMSLGIALGSVLDSGKVLICFDSLTTTLQYAEFSEVFEFLHAILGRIRAAGAHAHFHINPEAHDDDLVAALTALFDARVDTEDELAVQVRPELRPPNG